jgi:hypothetical protein
VDGAQVTSRKKSDFTVRIMIRAYSVIFCAALAACASPGMPPGGPVDTQAPQIVKVVPDSGKVGTTPPAVIFRFDEVVSERPSGAASLSALFLISPTDGEPRVDWHRDEISIRPRRGWKKNTAYTITLLPGLSDLRGNTRNTGAVTMFATGSTIPSSRISGILFNWAEGRAVTRGGVVQAWPRGDTTLVYVAPTDSAGAFSLGTLPPGDYVVRGLFDENNNRGLDRREPWDTAGVSVRDSARVNLYGFIHDSLGTRLQSVTTRDSVTLELVFDSPISIEQPITPAEITVRAPDSTNIGVVSVTPPPPDTTAVARALGRPIPPRSLTVKLSRPVIPKTSYRVRVARITSLAGITRSGEVLFTVPVAPPAQESRKPASPLPLPAPAPVRR